jgi:cytochrome c
MSSSRSLAAAIVAAVIIGNSAFAADVPPPVGRIATPAEIASWDIDARPDGVGLPDGKGSVSEGDDTFQANCAMCHGTFGEGAGYPRLAGEGSLTGDRPEQTIGSYWPYAVTIFDYVNRAMPYPAPHSLSADEVYGITAYLLNLNGLVPDDFVADRTSLPKVKMPNENGFTWKDPRPDTHDDACMTNCKPVSAVKIVTTAEGSRVTPRTTGPLDVDIPQ